jgi:hypothetical protein
MHLLLPYIGIRGGSCENTRRVRKAYAEGPLAVRGRSEIAYSEGLRVLAVFNSVLWEKKSMGNQQAYAEGPFEGANE